MNNFIVSGLVIIALVVSHVMVYINAGEIEKLKDDKHVIQFNLDRVDQRLGDHILSSMECQ